MDNFDIFASLGDIISKLDAPKEEAACDPHCPLHVSREGFALWLDALRAATDIEPEKAVRERTCGIATNNLNPVVRYIQFTMPPFVAANTKVRTARRSICIEVGPEMADSLVSRMGAPLGSGAAAVFEHPLPSWAGDYLSILRRRHEGGDVITLEDAERALNELNS